ncbi:MAG: glycosyltransferase family 4 protein [Pseudomonadota bacterium]
MRDIAFAVPGDINTPTGGYGYDRALISALARAGHTIHPIELGDGFPAPDEGTLERAGETLKGVPNAAVLVVDGLAYSVMPTEILEEIKAPLVALIHHPLCLETGLNDQDAKRLEAAERAALQKAKAVIVTSQDTARRLTELFGVPSHLIHVASPGISADWRQLRRKPVSPPKIVSVGSLSPRKGHDILIGALALLADLDFHCDIIGHMPPESGTAKDIAAQIDHLGLGDRVRLRGPLDQAEIGPAFEAASIFALATYYEGFGMVFAEAMAAGLPVVGTTGGAVPGVVPVTAGRLVPPGDPAAFATALRALLSDEALRMRLGEGARLAGQRFGDWDSTAKIVSQLVEAQP